MIFLSYALDACFSRQSTLWPVALSAVLRFLPLGALLPAVGVDAADHRLPTPWLRAAAVAALLHPLLAMVVGDPSVALSSALGAAACFAVLRLAAVLSGMGRGDLRLGSVVGLAAGFPLGVFALASATAACGAFMLVRRRRATAFGPFLVGGHVAAVAAGVLRCRGLLHG
ncbi:MAG: hypothetical protein ACOCYC_00855 [bacterium]